MALSFKATENEIDLCQFVEWYPKLQNVSIKSVILELDEDFIAYLKEDGVILPDSVSHYMGKDELSDEEDLSSYVEKGDKKTKRSFPHLDNQIKQTLERFNGEVFIKTNWSAPSDASWVNNNSLRCYNLHDVYALLKSSDRIIYDLENMYDSVDRVPGGKKVPDKFYLVLRKWANLIPSMEFRIFVKDNQLVGNRTVFQPFSIFAE